MGIENVDKPVAWAGHVVVLFVVLFCEGDKQFAVDVLNSEGAKPAGTPVSVNDLKNLKLES
jgi:hypothetical protein